MIMINTSTSLISDVIGNDSKNSAFVYGCYSLLDKFANGAVMFIFIERYSNIDYAVRWAITGIPIVCSALSFVLTYAGAKYYSYKINKLSLSIPVRKKDNIK